jgi:diguanylate cyclase (GGDEF)-like protein
LILLLTLVLSVVSAGTLGLTYGFDVKERKLLALEQVDTLGRALQHDLVLALVNPQADVYADISFRLSGFDSVAALAVLDADGVEVYRHVRSGTTIPPDLLQRSTKEPYFSDRYLYLRQPLVVDGFQYGEVVHFIDLTSYRTGLHEQLLSLLSIFPLELAIGLLVAVWIGRSYTRPFTELAQAMGAADVRHNRFSAVQTRAQNEIGVLYRGYNAMIDQIASVTRDLTYLSEHDSLTGLYNRYAIEQAIKTSLQDELAESHVLLALDLDQFKLVNDNAGHVAGNELLRQVGRICEGSLPSDAKVARVGGDDFYILLPRTSEQHGSFLARQLQDSLINYRFPWDGDIYSVSTCVGLLAFRPFEYTLEAVQTAVDSAFYAAKAKGNNQLHVYRPDDANVQQYSADVQAAAIIREALTGGPSRFKLFAQAIVPLQKSSAQINYEVLLRLEDAQGVLLTPDRFLPTANRYQLMVEIDSYVLWHYLETVMAHPEHVERLGFVNINLAGASLNNSVFQERLRAAVERFDFPWRKLVLEVTETSAVGNLAKAADFIAYCRGRGMRVALDDFGTGMASFEYLKFLPLDIVKIDGSFIRDMLTDPVDHAMVSYAHQISKLRGRETIAEFIENARHVEALKAIGIDYGQGYHLGRPRALSEWLQVPAVAEERARISA